MARVSYLARREGRYYLQVRCSHVVAGLLNQPLFRTSLRTADYVRRGRVSPNNLNGGRPLGRRSSVLPKANRPASNKAETSDRDSDRTRGIPARTRPEMNLRKIGSGATGRVAVPSFRVLQHSPSPARMVAWSAR